MDNHSQSLDKKRVLKRVIPQIAGKLAIDTSDELRELIKNSDNYQQLSNIVADHYATKDESMIHEIIVTMVLYNEYPTANEDDGSQRSNEEEIADLIRDGLFAVLMLCAPTNDREVVTRKEECLDFLEQLKYLKVNADANIVEVNKREDVRDECIKFFKNCPRRRFPLVIFNGHGCRGGFVKFRNLRKYWLVDIINQIRQLFIAHGNQEPQGDKVAAEEVTKEIIELFRKHCTTRYHDNALRIILAQCHAYEINPNEPEVPGRIERDGVHIVYLTSKKKKNSYSVSKYRDGVPTSSHLAMNSNRKLITAKRQHSDMDGAQPDCMDLPSPPKRTRRS